MPRRKRKKLEREVDLVVVADLYKRGWTMRQISAEISSRRHYSINHTTIKNDIDTILKRWREKQVGYIEHFVTIQLAQIQRMKKELWEEYIRSKLPLKSIREKRQAVVHTGIHSINPKQNLLDLELDLIFEDSTAAQTERKKNKLKTLEDVEIHFTDLETAGMVEVDQTMQLTESLGNPKYLELVTKLMEQEAKLLGFYKDDSKTGATAQVVVVNMPAPVAKNQFIPLDQQDNEG